MQDYLIGYAAPKAGILDWRPGQPASFPNGVIKQTARVRLSYQEANELEHILTTLHNRHELILLFMEPIPTGRNLIIDFVNGSPEPIQTYLRSGL